MYIISKFKDYYDILPNEKGDLPKYVRQTEDHDIGDRWKKERAAKTKEEAERVREFHRHIAHLSGRFHRMPSHPGDTSRFTHRRYDMGAIVFCGKSYPFYWVGDKACYTIEQVIKAYEQFAKNEINGDVKYKDILKKLRSATAKKWSRYGAGPGLTRGSWARYLEDRKSTEFEAMTRVSPDAHLYFNAPILYIGRSTDWQGRQIIQANPCLNKFNFASQIDPYTAYQELDMFLANTFTTAESPDLVMTEKLKVHSKGMDQWSFRTMPGDSPKTKKKRLKKQMKMTEGK